MEAAHTYPVSEVLQRFGVTENEGLTSERVAEAQKRYGPNGKAVNFQIFGLFFKKVYCDDNSLYYEFKVIRYYTCTTI